MCTISIIATRTWELVRTPIAIPANDLNAIQRLAAALASQGFRLAGSIDLGPLTSEDRERIYQMADDKSLGQTYYEEVEALKAHGTSNADAVREVAKKHHKKDNAVRGGIHQPVQEPSRQRRRPDHNRPAQPPHCQPQR